MVLAPHSAQEHIAEPADELPAERLLEIPHRPGAELSRRSEAPMQLRSVGGSFSRLHCTDSQVLRSGASPDEEQCLRAAPRRVKDLAPDSAKAVSAYRHARGFPCCPDPRKIVERSSPNP